MKVSVSCAYHMERACACMEKIALTARRMSVEGKPMVQDYPFWLYQALHADYETISFLAKSMPNIERFDLRPLYCILRSSLEKYADIANRAP